MGYGAAAFAAYNDSYEPRPRRGHLSFMPTMSHLARFMAISVASAALCVGVLAAQAPPRPVVVWTLNSPNTTEVQPGARVEVSLRAAVERGWYVYAASQPAGGPTALRITLPAGQPFALAGPVKAPAATRAWDAAFELESAKHEGDVTFTLPLQVAPGAEPGRRPLTVEVRYQACSDTLCLRPRTETLSLPFDIGQTAGQAPPRSSGR